MLNGYKICLNTTNYPIFKMKDFRYWLCTYILDFFFIRLHPHCALEKTFVDVKLVRFHIVAK